MQEKGSMKYIFQNILKSALWFSVYNGEKVVWIVTTNMYHISVMYKGQLSQAADILLL